MDRQPKAKAKKRSSASIVNRDSKLNNRTHKNAKKAPSEADKDLLVLGKESVSSWKPSPAEIRLEQLVFGSRCVGELTEQSDENVENLVEDAGTGFSDLEGEDGSSDEEDDVSPSERIHKLSSDGRRESKQPAWHDDTDDVPSSIDQKSPKDQGKAKQVAEKGLGLNQQQRLKSKFEKVVGSTPSWAKLKSEQQTAEDSSDEDDAEEEDALLRRTGDYLTTSTRLPGNNLNIKRVTNLNKEQPTEGRVTSVEFHPRAQVAMVAGLDQRLNLFQVEGRANPKIQSVFLEQFPIHCARFSSQGTEVVLTGKRRFFYIYDMLGGKVTQIPYIRGILENKLTKFEVSPDGRFLAFLGEYGNIHLLSAETKELITTLKMNGSVDAVTFSGDGARMMSFGDDGEVYVWDLSTRDCIHKFTDSGCLKGTTIAISPGSRYIATGSQSGVINIYDDQCLVKTSPSPLRAVMNLTTPVTATRFNSTNEILAAVSVYSKDVVKMVHLPSGHTFGNFPQTNEVLQCPCALAFSPSSGYFALGNNRGGVPLFRLKHYKDY